MTRVMALDYGKRRIGVAVNDEMGWTAQGLPTIERTRIREDLALLKSLAGQYGIARWVIGHPLHLSGREGAGAYHVREFADRLKEFTGIPVDLWDERWTSVQAHRVLDESGVKGWQRKGTVDRIAAVLILESWMAAHEYEELNGE